MGPQRLEPVEGAQPGRHNVDDDLAVIDQHPARIGGTLDGARGHAELSPDNFANVRGNRVELPVRWRRADDKVVENGGERAQIEQEGVISLLVVGGGRRGAAESKGTGVCGRLGPSGDGGWNSAFSFGGIIYF